MLCASIFGIWAAAMTNYSISFPDGRGPQILGTCEAVEEMEVAASLDLLLSADDATLTAAESMSGDPCDDDQSLRVHRKRLSEATLRELLDRAPLTDRVGEAIRSQSAGQSHAEMTSISRSFVATMMELAQQVSNLSYAPRLSGYEYIRVQGPKRGAGLFGVVPRLSEYGWVRRRLGRNRGVWHVDPGLCPRRGRLVTVLRKTHARHANIDFVLPAFVERMASHLPPEHKCAAERGAARNMDKLLARLSCTPALEVADVLFFAGNVYHRTQDNFASRLSIQVTPY